MVGICCIVGTHEGGIDELAADLVVRGDEEVCTFDEGDVSIGIVQHALEAETQPVRCADGSLLWIWGVIVGHEHRGAYTPRRPGTSVAEYCARLYDTYAQAFVAGLNSEFAGILLDPDRSTVRLFTDRLATRSIYHTRTPSGTRVVCSSLQPLARHPDVSLHVDQSFMGECLQYSRVLGVDTPVSGVKNLPPGSVYRIDSDGSIGSRWRYWWPSISPIEATTSRRVAQFAAALTAAVQERRTTEHREGVLLSGGVDSRAILGLLGAESVGIHLNEQFDREARAAQAAADTVGAEFRFIERDIEYYPRTLDLVGPLTNITGHFHQAHALAARDAITEAVDVVWCGQYSDTIIGGEYVPRDPYGSIPILGKIARQPADVRSVPAYVAAFDAGDMGGHNGQLPFVTGLPPAPTVLSTQLNNRARDVRLHKIPYPSWRSLLEWGTCYPISNVRSFTFYESLLQMAPVHYPYFDNRIIDWVLATPASWRYRRDIVADGLRTFAPALSSIGPHHLVDRFRQARTATNHQPPHVTAGGWTDHAALIRTHPFIESIIEDNEAAIEASPYFDLQEVWAYYYAHLDGADHYHGIYILATLLASNISLVPADLDQSTSTH